MAQDWVWVALAVAEAAHLEQLAEHGGGQGVRDARLLDSAMARAQNPNSANSQFFICYADAPQLNGKYTVFGEVVSGMDVVDKIAKVATGNQGFYENVPTTPVIIKSVKIISEK